MYGAGNPKGQTVWSVFCDCQRQQPLWEMRLLYPHGPGIRHDRFLGDHWRGKSDGAMGRHGFPGGEQSLQLCDTGFQSLSGCAGYGDERGGKGESGCGLQNPQPYPGYMGFGSKRPSHHGCGGSVKGKPKADCRLQRVRYGDCDWHALLGH